MLLLQERIPKATAYLVHAAELPNVGATSGGPEMPVRILDSPDTTAPEVQLLSNGRYHVMLTNAGGGYSRWKDLAVTRWREDPTCDNWGTFCYIRDVASGEFWSTAYQPTLKRAEAYEAIFSEGRAEFRRRDHGFETHTEIVVSPEEDIELRRVRITNRSWTRKAIDVTSYAEVVLAPSAADAMHPAFSNLFVQTEIIPERRAILCTRRPRSLEEKVPWMFHLLAVHGADIGRCLLRDGSHAIHRPREHCRRAASDVRARHALRHSRLRARSDCRNPVPDNTRSGAIGDHRYGFWHRRYPRSGPGPGGEIPGSEARGPGLRTGIDTQPGGAPADQRHRDRRAALQPARELRHLCECVRCAPTPPF